MGSETERNCPTNQWLNKQAALPGSIDLSVVIPAYNEERRLPPTLIDIVDFLDRKGMTYEVIVVDDGGSDSTPSVVEKFERVRSQVRLIRSPKNCGKGYAVKTGVLNAKGKYIMFADADGATPFAEFDRLMQEIQNGAEIAIGSRALASTQTKVETSLHRKLLGRAYNWCINLILLPGIADTQCGFKLFTRNAAQALFQNQRATGFSFDVEILYMARLCGFKIAEVPINWHNVPGSKVNLVLDAIRMFRDVLRFRFIHRDLTSDSLKANQRPTEDQRSESTVA